MTKSIQEFCRVGFVHFMLFKDCIKGEGDFSSISKILDDPYFDAIELSWIGDPTRRSRVAQELKSAKKSIAFGAQPVLLTQGLDINHLEESERRNAVEQVKAVIPQAYELGAEGFAVLSGKNTEEKHKSKAMEQLERSLVEIGLELKRYGDIPLRLETFDQLPYGKNCLIGSNADAALIAKDVRAEIPGFGLMIDLSHLPLQGETPAQAWQACGEYVVHAHIGNCVMNNPAHPMNGDEHPPFCIPEGENCVDELTDYLRVLLEGGYLNTETRPFLSFEVSLFDNWTPESAITNAKETLDAAWSRV